MPERETETPWWMGIGGIAGQWSNVTATAIIAIFFGYMLVYEIPQERNIFRYEMESARQIYREELKNQRDYNQREVDLLSRAILENQTNILLVLAEVRKLHLANKKPDGAQ